MPTPVVAALGFVNHPATAIARPFTPNRIPFGFRSTLFADDSEICSTLKIPETDVNAFSPHRLPVDQLATAMGARFALPKLSPSFGTLLGYEHLTAPLYRRRRLHRMVRARAKDRVLIVVLSPAVPCSGLAWLSTSVLAILHRMEPSRRFGLSTCHGWPLIWSLPISRANPRSVRSCPSDLCAGVWMAAPTGVHCRTVRASVFNHPRTVTCSPLRSDDCALSGRGIGLSV